MDFSSALAILSGLFLEVKVELLTSVMMENGKCCYRQHAIKSLFCSNLYLLECRNHY